MVVEQHSLCWVVGQLADNRDGETWHKELRQRPILHQTTQDGGTGLAKGVALVNQARAADKKKPILLQDDHFHVLREGGRALRRMQGRASKRLDKAVQADRKAAKKK